jgi:putative NIF3 family GTP cyclohydrolase 1 type 2
LESFARRVQDVVGGRAPLVISGGEHAVERVGIVSGAATDQINEAMGASCDTFLTGEPAERGYGLARDGGVHFLAAGHHATETLGIRRLGELLSQRFGIEHLYVDVPNPI